MPKKTILTAQKKEELCEALRKALPMTFACDLVGLPRSTVYDYLEKDEAFRTKVAIAKAEAIRGLIAMTSQQNGAWKLLKNLGKDEFKEHVEIKEESTHTLFLDTGDEEEEIPL